METKKMGNRYIGETGSTVSRGKRENSLGSSLTKNPAERVLMESHKRGGLVGSQQKKCHRLEGGAVDDGYTKKSSDMGTSIGVPLKRGGRAHRDMGGKMFASPGPDGGGFTPKPYSHGGNVKSNHAHAKKVHRALGGAINALTNIRDAINPMGSPGDTAAKFIASRIGRNG